MLAGDGGGQSTYPASLAKRAREGRNLATARRSNSARAAAGATILLAERNLAMKQFLGRALGCAIFALLVHWAASLSAIETTYGEDPVPDTYRSLSPPYTAYGMDPIPVKSPLERWLMFKNERQRKIEEREAARQSEPPRTKRVWRLW
jgi:hypothetical protein